METDLSRRDIADLVPTAFRLFGEPAVRRIASELQDPFSVGNVLVTLARLQSDPAAKSQTLNEAEQIALGITSGNRDFALRWVYEGYRLAGLEDDAERILDEMVLKPEGMDSPIQKAAEVSAQADAILHPSGAVREVDTPLARLHRLMEYRCNDLKVQFLVDMAAAGGVDHPELEDLIAGDDFARIEPPRPPSIYLDPCHLDHEKFAQFFFGRPVCQRGSDKELLEPYDGRDDPTDKAALLDGVAVLFENFGRVSALFSPGQVEQGLWHLFGHPFFLGEIVHSKEIPIEVRQRTINAMLHPFSQYYAAVGATYAGSVFFMWWDLLGIGFSDIEETVLAVIEQILELDSKPCQFSALHGLNHLFPNARASALVSQYLADRRSAMSAEDIAWVEACREGKAL